MMEYGLIGERLPHSFSREIHGKLADYDYELCEVPRGELDAYMRRHAFKAINVTIPYKEAVIPYLDELDASALLCGAVNTVVNRGGHLTGYNTDISGMAALMRRLGIDLNGKRVLILGTGGTSKTASALADRSGALETVRVSRTARDGAITYDDAYRCFHDADVIINTTPCGMYPNVCGTPIDIRRFGKLKGVADAVYNPLRTNLVLDALSLGITAEGGLYMLVAQAVAASELFTGTAYDTSEIDRVFREVLCEKENIILTGMPGAGKSTVGRILSQRLGRRLIDTDELIERESGRSIPEIFASDGESEFRNIESKAVSEAASANIGAVISTGGGAVLREDNVRALRRSGRVFYLDRPLSMLIPTANRPLAGNREAIEQRYRERNGIYRSTCDAVIDNVTSPDAAANAVIAALHSLSDR